MAQRQATCPLLPPHVATPGLLTQQASRPKCISAKRTQAQLHSKSAGSLLLLLPILSATPARGWVVSCPHLVFVLLLPIPLPGHSHPPNHGGNGSAPSQPRGAHGNAAPHPQLAAAVAAPARLPRLLLSVPPASAAAAAARGAGRARDEGGGGEDGRGDHREVRARVRPLESVQLQGRRGRRRGEEVADGPGQGAAGQVRRRVPGHLHLALHRLLHPLLPPHQRRRRRAGAARQGRDRDRRNRREGRDLRVGLRRAQGRVADQVPADGGADAGGGQLDWQDQEGRRLMRHHSKVQLTESCSLRK